MRFIDLTGRRVGMLFVERREGSVVVSGHEQATWLCRCDCGNFRVASSTTLLKAINRQQTNLCCGCVRLFPGHEVTAEWLYGQCIGEPNSGCWLWNGHANTGSGYGLVTYGRRQVGAHRVSYLLSVGPIPRGMFVCHHCDVRLCIRPDHLFVGTQVDNMADCRRKGRAPIGERHGNVVLTQEKVAFILSDPRSARAVAADLGVLAGTVAAVRKRSNWAHVNVPQPVRDVRSRGESHPHSVLSEQEVLAILRDPRPQRVIGRSYRVTQSAIFAIKSGKTWKHVLRDDSAGSTSPIPPRRARGVSHASAVLSEKDVVAILRDTRSLRAIAFSYGVDKGTIRAVRKRITWKHIFWEGDHASF